eukprot:gene8654-10247_t
MDEPVDDTMQLEGDIDFSAPTPPHTAATAGIFDSNGEVDHETFPQFAGINFSAATTPEKAPAINFSAASSPAGSPGINFSAATTPEKTQLPSLVEEDDLDGFDFDESLDVFSDEKKEKDDNQSLSDGSATKSKDRRHKKEKKEKKHKKEREKKEKDVEKVVKSTVNEEIEIVKKLENGPSKAELARRNLIEIDQDELEERVERLNRVTLKVITKSLGLSKIEQHQKIVECREFLKQYWNDETEGEGSLGDFVADTIAKQNSRVYGVNQAPGLDALDYLDKNHYSDDEWEAEEEVQTQAQALKIEVKTEKEEVKEVVSPAVVTTDSAASTEETKSSFIELSDSEDEDEEEEIVIVAPAAAEAPAAPVVPALSALEAAALQRAQQIELLKAQAAEKERRELEIRRERYLAAVKAPRTSRSALLTTLRQKVAVTAKENYCNQRKVRIKSEELTLRLQIADKCRQLVELLKERHEARDNYKREVRKAKYQQLADEEEGEFDSDAELNALGGVGGLGEGEFLTAEERAAYLRRFEEENEEEESEQDDLSEPEDMDNMMDIEGEEEELAPVDEERLGLQAVLDREEEVEEADDEGESENESEIDEGGESKSAVDTQMDTQLDTQLDTQRPSADQDEEEEEEVRVQRSARSSVVHTYGRVRLGLDHTTTTTISREHDNTVDTQVETQRETQEYTSESVHIDNNNQDEERDDLSLHSITTTRTTATTKTSKSKKSKSTGNMMYRLALEAEERRHRTRKGNNLVDDEAAEEEEEGLQAGLGDFGFGVTSNIREHDEEMDALKVRKGDFDNIVDDISDGEGDEAAGMQARAEMELAEDRARDRAIITAVTEGHDAMRNKSKKGVYSFEKLVGDSAVTGSRRRRKGEEGNDGANEVAEEEEDEEELMQRGMQNRLDKERASRARRGTGGGSDSESDSAEESDGDDDLLDQINTSDMTEEQKIAEVERLQRLREKNRMDALMAKQRIQSYKMARERVRQEKLQRQLTQQAQSQSQNPSQGPSLLGMHGHGSSSMLSGLARQESVGNGSSFMSRSMTLEPLHDEYSRLFMNTSSSSNLMPPPTTDGKLADITNMPEQQIKRRTSLAPKHAAAGDKRTMRRSHTTSTSTTTTTAPNGHSKTTTTSSTSFSSSSSGSGMYKGELNQREVQEGFGMGLAVKSNKVDLTHGLFSAVTGIRRFGDLANNNNNASNGASNGAHGTGAGASAKASTLKKRTFSEVGKLGSTVAAQQFVFGAGDEGSRMMGDSNSGFGSRGPLSGASSAGAPGVRRLNTVGGMPGGSLFAQLGAKRART